MTENQVILSQIPLEQLKEIIHDVVASCLNEKAVQNGNPKNREGDAFLTAKEAAQFLKVSLVSIHNWKREKGLPYHRLGRSIRFKKSELIEFAQLKKGKK